MSEYKYFYPDGEEITAKGRKSALERFIEFYSRIYRYVNHKQWDSEVKMENYLGRKNGTSLTTKSIADIIAWKVNRKLGPLEIAPFQIDSRGGTMTIEDELWEDDKFKQFCGLGHNIDCESAQKFIRSLIGCDPEFSQPSNEIASRAGIKFVYAITLLYFISKGRYPIYDRYAHVGLKSVCSGGNPTDEQSKITESYYCSKMFHSPCHHGGAPITGVEFDRAWGEYLGYKSLLMGEDGKSKGIFGDVYAKHGFHYRDVDRALWAYGHLFYVS